MVPAVRDPGGNMKMRSLGSRLMALMLSLCIAVPPLLQARVEPSHGFDMFSPQEEVQAGQQASAQASKQLPLLPDSDPVVKYVQRLGAQLAAHAPGQKWPYSFHVVNQKEINAFALPGGPVYVNRSEERRVGEEGGVSGSSSA